MEHSLETRVPKFIRLVREEVAVREKGMEWLAGVWSLDTPAGRAALNRLVVLGDAQYGGGSHWIEARGNVDLGRDLPPVAGI